MKRFKSEDEEIKDLIIDFSFEMFTEFDKNREEYQDWNDRSLDEEKIVQCIVRSISEDCPTGVANYAMFWWRLKNRSR